MRKIRGSVYIIVLLTVVLVLFTQMGDKDGNDASVYRIGFEGKWGVPSPYEIVPRGPGFAKLYMVYDTLAWKNTKGELAPQIAEEWHYSSDDLTYRFVIREDVKWHDGKPLTINDVKFSFDYYREHPLEWLDLSMIDEVTIIDKDEIVVRLKTSYQPFMTNIIGSMPMLPKHIYQQIEDPYRINSRYSAIGSGPFVFKSYLSETGDTSLSANSDYYLGSVSIKELHFISINQGVQSSALARYELDSIFVSNEVFDELVKKGFTIISHSNMLTKLSFNMDHPILKDKGIRQAIAHSLDRNEIIAIARRKDATIGESGIIDTLSPFYYDEVKQYDHSSKKTAELMKNAGFTKVGGYYSKDNATIKLSILAYEDVKRDAEIIARQLNDAGFDASVSYSDLATVDSHVAKGTYDLVLVEDAAVGDPVFLNRMIEYEVKNGSFDKKEQLLGLLDQQLHAETDGKRQLALNDIQDIYSEEIPSLVLYYQNMHVAHNERVDLAFTPNGYSFGIMMPYNPMVFIK